MASPNEFARRIRRLGRTIESNTDRLFRETSLAVLTEVVVSTPVDTGRARGNWNVGLGAAPDPTPEQQEATADTSGQPTIARGSVQISQRRSGQAVFLSNNVPYIEPLNAGSSAQAPAGFVENAVQAGVDVVRRARLLE